MDTGTPPSKTRQFTPNHVLIGLRGSRGRPRLAKELEDLCRRRGWDTPDRATLEKALYRFETGRVTRPDDFYTRLLCEFYQRSAHEIFGDLEANEAAGTRNTLGFRSHKFIPLFIGAEAAAALVDAHSMREVDDQWTACHRMDVDNDLGICRLYVWPFGVAMFHLVEERQIDAVAELALWRRESYARNKDWAHQTLKRLTATPHPSSTYVLSLYWVTAAAWDAATRRTALQLMCIPRSLLKRDDVQGSADDARAHALLVERELLREGFDHPELVDFGMKGISCGFASWSGVVYHPIAEDRALHERDLVACELAVQAMWAYCDHIRSQVEEGTDPDIPTAYGWRFLRAMRSRITTERPTETSQHRAMREAIVETSGLAKHLALALETLRECEGR
ncbi:helix-turn-helix domain-containing protein [Yinghuangia sp. YIM S10712]|uniref:helix-turn-helix domain-containing protein n=1 Tax=Yinghuangia sp. YIM S10712 TaxID=3436930 RepID=UPI003F52B483